MIKELEHNVDIDKLQFEVKNFLGKHDFWDTPQVSLTSITGENDWFCSIGKISHLSSPEKAYSTINKELEGSYIAEVINEYSKYYRWRLLNLRPGLSYTVHHDDRPGSRRNKRLHIPIVTNWNAFFCYHTYVPAHNLESTVKYHHLKYGNVYEADTSYLHNAINWGKEPRVHLVGVRYEKVAVKLQDQEQQSEYMKNFDLEPPAGIRTLERQVTQKLSNDERQVTQKLSNDK